MTRCGPWDGQRRVGLAVSGGADSMAMAVLAKAWGDPVAYVVDHGLRSGSAAEAAWTTRALGGLGIPARTLTLFGLRPGSGLAARARTARHSALEQACAADGLVDLLYGHHARDQAETVAMRQDRGSGPAGLAGMAAVVEGDLVRRVRPLLGVSPDRLRATLVQAGLTWIEDPSNHDPRAGRTLARLQIGDGFGPLTAQAGQAATERARQEEADAAELASRAAIYPEGYALLSPGLIRPGALAALLRMVAGSRYPVSGIATLAHQPRAATLGGARLMPAGRHGQGWLVVREERAVAEPIAAAPGAVWDGRYRVAASTPDATLGKLGDAATRFRKASPLPAAVLRVLPAFRCNGVLCHIPHLSYAAANWSEHGFSIRAASLPATGAPFQG